MPGRRLRRVAGLHRLFDSSLFDHTDGGFGPGYWLWLLGATTLLGGLASLAEPPVQCRLGSSIAGGLGVAVAADWLVIGRLANGGRPVLWPSTANLPFIDRSPLLVYSLLVAANVVSAMGYTLQWRRQRHQAVRLAFKGQSRSAGYLPIEHYG